MPARPGRVANDWLPYIRPHLRPYEALGRGERRDYIANLSMKMRLFDNTLRRFIAAATSPVVRQNGMSDEKTHFLEEAARCRRLAARINDTEAVTRLVELAEEYEAKAEKEKKRDRSVGG